MKLSNLKQVQTPNLNLDTYDVHTMLSDDVSGEQLLASILDINDSMATKLDFFAGNAVAKPAVAQEGAIGIFDENRAIVDSGVSITTELDGTDETVPTSAAVNAGLDTKPNKISQIYADGNIAAISADGTYRDSGFYVETEVDDTPFPAPPIPQNTPTGMQSDNAVLTYEALATWFDNKIDKPAVDYDAGNIMVSAGLGAKSDIELSDKYFVSEINSSSTDNDIPGAATIRDYITQQQLAHTNYQGKYDYFGSQAQVQAVTNPTSGQTAIAYAGDITNITAVYRGDYTTSWAFTAVSPAENNGMWLFAEHLLNETSPDFGMAIYKDDGVNPPSFDTADFNFAPDGINITFDSSGRLTFRFKDVNTDDGSVEHVLYDVMADSILYDTTNTIKQKIDTSTATLQYNLNTLSGNLTTTNNNLTALSGDLDTTNANLGVTNSNITALSSEVDTLSDELSTLETQVGNIHSLSKYSYNATLSTTWSGSGPFTQTVTVSGILNTDNPDMFLVESTTTATAITQNEEYAKLSSNFVVNNGNIVVKCLEEKPIVALPIVLRGVR